MNFSLSDVNVRMHRATIRDDPRLFAEWNFERNGNIVPVAVARCSNSSFWWRCAKGHEWQAIANNRAKGQGCPFCAGKRADTSNSLLALNPKLAAEWHRRKNGHL